MKIRLAVVVNLIVLFVLSGSTYLSSTVIKKTLLIPEYFVDDGGSGSTCSQILPCLLAEALKKTDTEMNIYLAAGTYTGTGDEVVLINSDKVINLYGGWDGASSGPINRDPETHMSIIDGEGARRGIKIVFTHSPALTPIITGLSVTRGLGSVTSPGCNNATTEDGCGGGIYIFCASPEIYQNKIYGNIGSTKTIPLDNQGIGGGIYSIYSSGARIHDNLIYENYADTIRQGRGGGVELADSSADTEFYNNQVYLNKTVSSYSEYNWTWGAGISLDHDGSQVYGNSIHDNGEIGGSNESGSGIYLWYGSPVIRDNLFFNNHGADAVYLGYGNDTVFERNRIWDNSSLWSLNVLYSIRADLYSCAEQEYVTIKNNLIAGGTEGGLYLYGYESYPLCTRIWHNSIDGGLTGVFLDGPSTVVISNNIISNHDVGIDLAVDASSPTVNHTLFFNNLSDGIIGTNSLTGDPRYINREVGNLHIWCISPARDAGDSSVGVADDIDRETRPIGSGVEIGADECTPLFYLPLIKKP
jgi:hypothetical protein